MTLINLFDNPVARPLPEQWVVPHDQYLDKLAQYKGYKNNDEKIQLRWEHMHRVGESKAQDRARDRAYQRERQKIERGHHPPSDEVIAQEIGGRMVHLQVAECPSGLFYAWVESADGSHVWIPNDNKNGLFMTYNPTVACGYTLGPVMFGKDHMSRPMLTTNVSKNHQARFPNGYVTYDVGINRRREIAEFTFSYYWRTKGQFRKKGILQQIVQIEYPGPNSLQIVTEFGKSKDALPHEHDNVSLRFYDGFLSECNVGMGADPSPNSVFSGQKGKGYTFDREAPMTGTMSRKLFGLDLRRRAVNLEGVVRQIVQDTTTRSFPNPAAVVVNNIE
jgi:hypothetical protein